MNAKKIIALLLALVMCVGLLAGCGNNNEQPSNSGNPSDPAPSGSTGTEQPTGTPEVEATYTYQDSVSTLATNWNPHTYQTTDDSYPADFLRSGLYTFIFNDELNPIEGTDPYEGYVIIPEMAAEMPVDVTEAIKAAHPEFNIPESATSGYAYEIKLNPDACWEDGTPINADTYVYSMQQLLDPKLLNYRASDYYDGDLCIAGAKAYNNQGSTAYAGALGMSVDEFLANGGTMDEIYIDIGGFWGIYTADGKSFASINDDTLIRDPAIEEGQDEDYVSPKYLYETYLANGCVYEGYQSAYLGTAIVYEDGIDFSNVGIIKNDDYSITLVLEKSLAGFYLLYNLSGNWIVYQPYYDACLKEDNGYWSSTYNTSVETTMSYGPYKMTQYQTDKFMKFERNENWWGYSDGKHVYVDPEDGETYDMYMTDVIECEVVAEAATRKLMFLKGELMGYGLQSEDFEQYRSSDYVYFTPGQSIFFLILNGHKTAIHDREAAADFDKNTTDLETMTLPTFRSAVAVAYDKELFAATVSPARSGAYGIIGTAYVYDPETGARYRDTDQAKQTLCDYYGVDVSKYASLDEAVDSITGYDPVLAKELFNKAFNEALAEGYITDADGNGISDQTVTIEYALSSDSDFMTTTINYLNEKMAEATAGTGFEGKVLFVKSAPYGNDWSEKIRQGLSDTVLGGWTGSALNPYGLTDLYVNPSRAYDAAWFDATTVEATMNINGEEITMTMMQWSDCLNGETVTVNGKDYNFGAEQADQDTRVTILANFEKIVLGTGNYLPMLQDASAALLSQQVFYVVDEYNPVMGRGGIQYLKYNYNDADWAAYVASQPNGELTY